MILTYEQADRFYTLINALLGYANERFEVVRELPLPIVDLESQSKAALVAETLWDSVGIIDDFVRENPFDLPKRFLDTALAWKDALTGSFVFAGHEDGRALLMGDEDVFAVAGIQLEPSELLSEWPDVGRTTLLPFDDLIVYDGMLNVLGIEFGPEVAASAQADFKERRAKGLVRTAADFVARSRALNEAGRNRAVERLLADAERDARIAAFGEQLPPGFHRGALAGLTEAERAAAFDERFDAWDEGRFEQKEAILRERGPRAGRHARGVPGAVHEDGARRRRSAARPQGTLQAAQGRAGPRRRGERPLVVRPAARYAGRVLPGRFQDGQGAGVRGSRVVRRRRCEQTPVPDAPHAIHVPVLAGRALHGLRPGADQVHARRRRLRGDRTGAGPERRGGDVR